MADLFPFTLADEIHEVKRELAQRRRVYPRMVSAGTLRQDKADRQIAVMEAVLRRLEALQ
jgi:hypothetical protein